MSVESNFILSHFEENVLVLQALVNANPERNVTKTDAMSKGRKLLESCHSIFSQNCSVKISKLTQAVQPLTGLDGSKDSGLVTMSGLVVKASRLK